MDYLEYDAQPKNCRSGGGSASRSASQLYLPSADPPDQSRVGLALADTRRANLNWHIASSSSSCSRYFLLTSSVDPGPRLVMPRKPSSLVPATSFRFLLGQQGSTEGKTRTSTGNRIDVQVLRAAKALSRRPAHQHLGTMDG